MSSPLSPHYYEFCRYVGRLRCLGMRADIVQIDGSIRLIGVAPRWCPKEHHNDNG